MKTLKSFEKDIQCCSKCGLCQAVCPKFQQSGNECDSLKGKLIMLNEILKGNLNFDKKIQEYINGCKNCDKCFNSCPAGINIKDILACVITD